jgi:hypothetical protein
MPTDRRVIRRGVPDLAQMLTGRYTIQGFARLVLGQLRLAAEPYAFRARLRRRSLLKPSLAAVFSDAVGPFLAGSI